MCDRISPCNGHVGTHWVDPLTHHVHLSTPLGNPPTHPKSVRNMYTAPNAVERSYSIKIISEALYGGWKHIGNNRYTIAYKLRAPLNASNVVKPLAMAFISSEKVLFWMALKHVKVVCCKPHKVH